MPLTRLRLHLPRLEPCRRPGPGNGRNASSEGPGVATRSEQAAKRPRLRLPRAERL